MDWLSWLRGILVVALFGWLFEALQPASSMKRYTRLVIGLLLMVAVLHPLVGLLGGRLPALARPFWSDRDVQGLLRQGVFLQEQEEGAATASYRKALVRAAEAAALGVQGVQRATADVSVNGQDEPLTADLTLRAAAPTPATAKAARSAVATALGIAQGSVRVTFSEGGALP